MWPYAVLTSDAARCGGPSSYRESLYEDGYRAGVQDGKADSIEVATTSAAIGALVALLAIEGPRLVRWAGQTRPALWLRRRLSPDAAGVPDSSEPKDGAGEGAEAPGADGA